MKIKKFNKFFENRTALTQPSDKEVEEAEEYLEKGVDKDWDQSKSGLFYIDVSGKYSVYYTLWRYKPSSHFKQEQFITNLSTDFQTAVEKAKKAAGRIPVIIDRYGTKSGMFQAIKAEKITFGKYRGKTLGDIFVEDPKYIVWMYKNYISKSKERTERIKYYYDLHMETITKKNVEESKSEFVGKIGEKITIDAEAYKVTASENNFNNKIQYGCKLIDEEGNKYMTYSIGQPIKDGDSIKLTAKVKDHKEFLGIKFTAIYYCKIISVHNLKDDMEKYNM